MATTAANTDMASTNEAKWIWKIPVTPHWRASLALVGPTSLSRSSYARSKPWSTVSPPESNSAANDLRTTRRWPCKTTLRCVLELISFFVSDPGRSNKEGTTETATAISLKLESSVRNGAYVCELLGFGP